MICEGIFFIKGVCACAHVCVCACVFIHSVPGCQSRALDLLEPVTSSFEPHDMAVGS